jgi:hypothetical protein
MLLVAGLAVALRTSAQVPPYYVVTTNPPVPSASSDVTIIVSNACSCPVYDVNNVSRQGFTFSVPSDGFCVSVCIPYRPYNIHVGHLEPGTYTVSQFSVRDPTHVETIGSFVVSADVPVFTPSTVLALFIMLAAVGATALRAH